MAQICAHCGSGDTQAGFDRYQCLTCGGFTNYRGDKVVPTSALAPDATTFEGPGGELVADDTSLPTKATVAMESTGPVPADGSSTESAPSVPEELPVPPEGPRDDQPVTGAPVPSTGADGTPPGNPEMPASAPYAPPPEQAPAEPEPEVVPRDPQPDTAAQPGVVEGQPITETEINGPAPTVEGQPETVAPSESAVVEPTPAPVPTDPAPVAPAPPQEQPAPAPPEA